MAREGTVPIDTRIENIQIDIAVIKKTLESVATREQLIEALNTCQKEHRKMINGNGRAKLNMAQAAFLKAAVPLLTALAAAITTYFSVVP